MRRCSLVVRDCNEKLREDEDCEDGACSRDHGQKSDYGAAADGSMTLDMGQEKRRITAIA